MTTQEVADKLVGLCREGKYEEAYGLYAKDAVSVEMPGVPNEKNRRAGQYSSRFLPNGPVILKNPMAEPWVIPW